MMTCSWHISTGWAAPEIRPYGPLSIMPIASVLHYATECFEGLKAYRGYDGKVRLFRPERNAARLLKSATRVALPGFPPEEFVKLLKRFVAIEAPKWLPQDRKGSFLYLRPTMIATAPALGIQKPREALLYIIAVCFPPLDEPKLMPNPVTGKISLGMRLIASSHDMIRAWPGGFGNAKVGANYGPSLVAQAQARDQGYDQILWLFGDECYVTEAGGSNLFILWKTKQGTLELVTAPLGDGVILQGVTRHSVIELVKERFAGEIELVERKFTMAELVEVYREKRLLEAFGSGTAFFIAPIADIHFRGVDIELPLARGEPAKYAMTIKGWLKDIMYGREQHEWAHVIKEEAFENNWEEE
jgi:branched-chain amino acid aminotransferase